MKAELIPMDGSPPIRISKDVTVVGRRAYCDVQVDDPSLSKRHCVLVKTDGLLVIRDLATTNGTKVKGQKIRWAALLPEDRVALGSVKFRVYLGPDDLPSPSEPGYKIAPEPRRSKPGGEKPDRPVAPAESAAPLPRSAGPVPGPSRALTAPDPGPAPRPPRREVDLPPLQLDGVDWLDAAKAGVAEDEEFDDLIIDLD